MSNLFPGGAIGVVVDNFFNKKDPLNSGLFNGLFIDFYYVSPSILQSSYDAPTITLSEREGFS